MRLPWVWHPWGWLALAALAVAAVDGWLLHLPQASGWLWVPLVVMAGLSSYASRFVWNRWRDPMDVALVQALQVAIPWAAHRRSVYRQTHRNLADWEALGARSWVVEPLARLPVATNRAPTVDFLPLPIPEGPLAMTWVWWAELLLLEERLAHNGLLVERRIAQAFVQRYRCAPPPVDTAQPGWSPQLATAWLSWVQAQAPLPIGSAGEGDGGCDYWVGKSSS